MGILKEMKPYLKDEDGIIHINPFICPECGSKNGTSTSSAYQSLMDKVELEDPWYTEFEFINCMSCRRSIPGTLGYRYGEAVSYTHLTLPTKA